MPGAARSMPDGLIYKTHYNNEPVAVPAAEPECCSFFGDYRDQLLVESVGDALGMQAADLRADYNQKIADLRRQVDRLEGQVAALLTLLGKSGADIVPLP